MPRRLFDRISGGIRRKAGLFKLDAWVLSGRERSGGEPFCFAFAGSEPVKNYQAESALAEGRHEQYLGKLWAWKVAAEAKTRFPDCSLVVHELDGERAGASRLVRTDLKNPVFMPMELSVVPDPGFGIRKPRFKDIIRLVNGNGLECEVRTDDAAFEDFYHGMYLPTARARHGDAAMTASYAGLKARYPFSELIVIRREGEALGALQIDYGQGKPRLLEMGIRDGAERYAKMGVLGAAYYFSFKRILERAGPTAASLGNARGMLKDRALLFKLSLGASLAVPHYEKTGCLHLRFLDRTPGLKNFLVQNPMIVLDRNGKYRAAFFAEKAETVSESDLRILRDLDSGPVRPRFYVFEPASAGARKDLGGCEVLPAGPLFP